ncbi:MAG: peptidoglycan-associated lipoprotein Pal [Pseudomonadota bacterium]
MFAIIRQSRSMKFALITAAALALGACAKNQNQNAGIGLGSETAAPGTPKDFVVNVGDRVLFDTDSSQINAAGRATLDRQAQWLLQYSNYTFTVEGHADERGTREYNLALGGRRAAAAKNYLVSKGVSAARIKTVSFGKERPVAVCNDISCWSQNRRAVSVLAGSAGS